MNKIFFFLITFLFVVKLFAQAEPPEYVKAAAQFKKYYNNNNPDSIFSEFSPEMKTVLPEDKFKITTNQLKEQLGGLLKTEFFKYEAPLAVYKATFQKAVFLLNISLNNKNQFTGLLLSPYEETAAQDQSVTESPVSVKTLSGTVSGTLAMPKNATGKIPVVLIIPGSGQVDRDGNGPNMNSNVYKLLAVALGKNGIASLRYDKRMIGQSVSAAKETDMRFDDYIDDAYSLISMLSSDQHFSKVIVMGHGQGSLVGMIAANNENVNSYISVEGTALTADKVLTDQINKSYPAYIAEGFKKVLDTLRRGKINYKVDPALYPVARPSLQGYILSWWRFDPQVEIKKLKKPILIIQGSTDLDVDVTNAEKLKKGKLPVLVIINDMNYVLKEAPADKEKNKSTYTNPQLPLKPELVTTIVDFIKK
ncbi:MAG: alpha/beta hydrolase [Mucilaginibacter sp.]|nr:alpha/beta hydrolase [Mucilaginibacter sp.]